MDRKDSLSVIILKGILSVGILHATVDYVRVICKFSLYLWWLCCPLLLVAGCRLAGAALLGGRLFLGCCSACREAVGGVVLRGLSCRWDSAGRRRLCCFSAGWVVFGGWLVSGVAFAGRGLSTRRGSRLTGVGVLDSPGRGQSYH